MARSLFLLACAFAIGLGMPPAVAEEQETLDWPKARSKARKLFERPGDLRKKKKAVENVAEHNSQPAAELLVTWALRSTKFREKILVPEQTDAREKYDRVEKQLLKAYKVGSLPAPKMQSEHRNAYRQYKAARDNADANIQAELMLQKNLGAGIRTIRDPAAVRWMAENAVKKLEKADGVRASLQGVALAMLDSKLEDVLPVAMKLADPNGVPSTVVAILNWLTEHRPAGGFDVLARALEAKHPAVQRAATWGLQRYNDLRAVKVLIDALPKVDGLIAEEIENTLHWYTGQSFNADGNVWKRWWKDEGEAWVAKGVSDRHEPEKSSHSSTGTSFYDIPTESHRIVFVLDRSGSMKTKAGDKAKERKKKQDKPKGPVTGKRKKKKDDDGPVGHVDGPVAGDTKMELAKNQLARSIKSLPKDVNFNLVFYSSDIQVWKEPPELVPASSSNKKAATEWFMKLDPNGNTKLFEALTKALEYAEAATAGKRGKKIAGGADTIFLLSDGSPTGPDGKPWPQNIVEQQYQAFKKANEKTRCIVHTIGIGPGHSRWLMERIARESGGEYRSVGAN